MSLGEEQPISCSRCRQEQPFTVWSSVNVTEDPKLKDQLLTHELTTFRCSRCGHEAHVAFDLLYHDMDKRLAIWLKYPDDTGRFGVDPLARDLFAAITDEYTCRRVPSFQELLEKILVFDSGLNDYAVELAKLLICIREGIEISSPLYYYKTCRSLLSGRRLVLARGEGDEMVEVTYPWRRTMEAAESILSKLGLSHGRRSGDWQYVTREFMLHELERAGLMRQLS